MIEPIEAESGSETSFSFHPKVIVAPQAYVRVIISMVTSGTFGTLFILAGFGGHKPYAAIFGVALIGAGSAPWALFQLRGRLILDQRGFMLHKVGRARRVEWDNIKELSLSNSGYAAAGIKVVLRQTGAFGLHRYFVIPDLFDIKREDLLPLMQKLRAGEAIRGKPSGLRS